MPILVTRRRFMASTATAGLAIAGGLAMAAIAARARPLVTHGVQSGDARTTST